MAVTPAVGQAVIAAHAVNPSAATVMSHHDMGHAADMADCHGHQTKPMQTSADIENCMAICAMMFLGFANASFPTLVLHLQAESLQPLAAQCPSARMGTPPFRPPRV